MKSQNNDKNNLINQDKLILGKNTFKVNIENYYIIETTIFTFISIN